MAKLINRYALFDAIRNITYNSKDADAFFEEVLEVITEQPTTTEADIRASAISDFLQFVYDNASNEEYANEDGWAMSDLIDLEFKFAEQLKEHSRKLNRCDTCTHYVADEVPPICYFCCKGMEDNYEAKE